MRHPLFLLACIFAASTLAAPPTTAPYDCRWTDHPIVLNPTNPDPAWKNAVVIEHFQKFWEQGDARTPKVNTRAMLLWDADYLYFRAEMEDTDLYSYGTRHQDFLWNGDVFELFFKPAEDKPAYYEFEVNPGNVDLELAFPDKPSKVKFDDIVSGTKIDMKTSVALRGTVNKPDDKDEGWTVEGRIPFKDLTLTGGKPEAGATWKFALQRWDHESPPSKVQEPSSSAPLTKPDFHRTEDYSPLHFVGPAAK